MYFVFTTMTTVGFGDYFPVSDTERLAWTAVLLSGVICFSYFMGILLEMIIKIKNFDDEFENEDDLEKFFLLLKRFNGGRHLKQEL